MYRVICASESFYPKSFYTLVFLSRRLQSDTDELTQFAHFQNGNPYKKFPIFQFFKRYLHTLLRDLSRWKNRKKFFSVSPRFAFIMA